MNVHPNVRAAVDAASKKLADEGLLIAGGFAAFHIVMLPTATPAEVAAARVAYMAGAQHLFASVVSILDADREPTTADLLRMSLIDVELRKFADEMKLRATPAQGAA